MPTPKIIETGCIRAKEDWSGTGFSSYPLRAFAVAKEGRLESVDITPANISFA